VVWTCKKKKIVDSVLRWVDQIKRIKSLEIEKDLKKLKHKLLRRFKRSMELISLGCCWINYKI